MRSVDCLCRARPRWLLSSLAVLAFVRTAHGSGNHQSAPMGGRSALMGGTGVALAVDGAAPFLNPATIGRIEDLSVSFTSRFLRYSERTIDAFHQPGAVDSAAFGALQLDETTISSTEFDSLPDSTCVFFGTPERRGAARTRAGSYRVALCLAKVEQSLFVLPALNFSGTSAGRRVQQSQSVREEWSRRAFGPALSYALTDDLAVGVGLFGTRAKLRSAITSVTASEELATAAVTRSTYFEALDAYSWDVLLHAGATYHLTREITLGLSIRTPTFVHVHDHIDTSYDASFEDATATSRLWQAEGEFSARPPPRLALGLGVEAGRLRLELDGFLYAGQSDFARAEMARDVLEVSAGQAAARRQERLVVSEDVDPVVDAGLGVEYFVARDVSLVSGVGFDASALSELRSVAPETRLFRSRGDIYHAAFGVAVYGGVGDVMVGFRGDYMSGQMAVVNAFVDPNRLEVVDAREWGLTLVLAGRLGLSNVLRAADRVEDAVDGQATEPEDRPAEPMRVPRR
jgi:hypothetical protein